MIKSQSQCSSKGGVNLICLNTIYAPKNWRKVNLWESKLTKISVLQPFLEKLKNLTEKLEKKSEKKSQKIELAFHVISIEVVNKQKQQIRCLVSA